MDLAELSDEDLVESVLTWAARVARGEARLLALVAELDRRETWAQHGVGSCAAWLSWKLGWAMGTAWERVRVARALRDLPLLRAELEAGRLSYCKARALTRVATPQDEARWLQLARASTGAQLDEACRGAERARAADRDPAEQQPKQQVRVDWDDDGDLLLTLRIPAHQAPAVLAALEQHQAAEQTEREQLLQGLLTEALGAPADSSAEDRSAQDSSPQDSPAEDSSAEDSAEDCPAPDSSAEEPSSRDSSAEDSAASAAGDSSAEDSASSPAGDSSAEGSCVQGSSAAEQFTLPAPRTPPTRCSKRQWPVRQRSSRGGPRSTSIRCPARAG